jgi:hypothetical protein
LWHLPSDGLLDEGLVVPTGAPAIHAGVDHGGLEILMPENLLDAFKITRVSVEHDLGCEMPKLMGRERDAGPPFRIRHDQVSDGALRLGGTVGMDEEPRGTMSDVRRGETLAILNQHLREMGRNIEPNHALVLDLLRVQLKG